MSGPVNDALTYALITDTKVGHLVLSSNQVRGTAECHPRRGRDILWVVEGHRGQDGGAESG